MIYPSLEQIIRDQARIAHATGHELAGVCLQ